MKYVNNYINSEHLKATDLPRPDAKWQEIIKFASTFDFQKEIDKCSCTITSVFDVTPTNSISELRYALYADWRRYNHVGDFITEGTFEKAQEIIEWLREEVL